MSDKEIIESGWAGWIGRALARFIWFTAKVYIAAMLIYVAYQIWQRF